MARRSDHTPQELKGLAIQAGIELIEKKGFSEFSARAVAAKIGYTVGTLYHLFGSLDQFILQINANTLDLWYQDLKRAAQHQRGHPIRSLAKAYIRFCKANTRRWSALYEHQLPAGVPIPEWYSPKMDRIFALVEQALIPYTNKDRRKAKRAAKILWAGIHGLCVLSISGKLDVVGAESAQVLAKELVDRFLVGLKA